MLVYYFLLLSRTKLRTFYSSIMAYYQVMINFVTYLVKIFQSFAFKYHKEYSWLTSQYVLKLYILIYVQFSKNNLRNMVSQN